MKIMNFKKSKKGILFFLFSAALISIIPSCVKDNFEFDKLAKTEWNPNIAVPLVYSSLTIQDILTRQDKQGVISVGSDNFCTLIYKGNLFSLVASDLVQLPDQTPPTYSASLTPAQIAVLSSSGTVTGSYSQTVTFATGTNSPKIDSMIFKSGSIDVSFSSDFKHSGQILIKIPGAKKNGVMFSKTLPITYSGSVPVIAAATYDLTGYNFNMSNGGNYNEFVINYDITLTGSGFPPSITDKVTLSQSLHTMNFDRIFGDIGQLSLSPDKDTVAISIFKNSIGTGTFTLVDPKVKVIISNSYGVPIDATVGQLDGYNPGVTTYPITGSPSPLPILSPNFSQIGQVLTGSYTLNSTNSNIVPVVNNTPKYLIYKINSLSNPSGTTHSNFVLDTSRFKVDMELELPLWGTAKDFALIDTIDFKMEQAASDNVESVLLRTYNSNGFPIDFDVQVYFVDSMYTKLDSLVVPNQLILKSANINLSTGLVTSPTVKTYDATLDQTRLKKLKTTKYMLVKAVANTTNGGSMNVKIYSNYRLDVKFGLQVHIKTKI